MFRNCLQRSNVFNFVLKRSGKRGHSYGPLCKQHVKHNSIHTSVIYKLWIPKQTKSLELNGAVLGTNIIEGEMSPSKKGSASSPSKETRSKKKHRKSKHKNEMFKSKRKHDKYELKHKKGKHKSKRKHKKSKKVKEFWPTSTYVRTLGELIVSNCLKMIGVNTSDNIGYCNQGNTDGKKEVSFTVTSSTDTSDPILENDSKKNGAVIESLGKSDSVNYACDKKIFTKDDRCLYGEMSMNTVISDVTRFVKPPVVEPRNNLQDVLNTSPPENPGSSESSLKIIDSHITKNVFEKAVGVGVTPLQYQDIKSWTVSNKEAKTSQGGQCLVEPGRYWIYSETMMEDASKWRKFKLMSYNVLSQSLLEEHPYLYTQNDPRTLDWNFRSRLLFAEIRNLNADILCLQEVENEHVYLFERQLQMLGYRGIYKKRSHKRVDGVAIFYKADTFVLQEYTSVEFFQPNVPVLNRDNVALIAKLAHRDLPGQSVVVATTHLLFNMNRHDVKLAQTQLLMAEVERFAYSGVGKFGPKYFPVVITGDMNFTPFSGVYKFLTEGRLRYKGLFKKNLTDRYGNGAVFNNTLLPRSLHVMDSCQHWGILPLREKGTPDRRDEMKHIKVYNSDFTLLRKIQSPWDMKFGEDATSGKLPHPGTLQLMDVSSEVEKKDAEDGKDCLTSDRFETGVLTHPFNLHSAYTDHDSEVTTHHKKWVTVDYVFYSVPKDELESGLTLLATYKLPTFDEATRSGPIPNFKSPSDHYPLLVMFGLNSDVQKMQH